MAQTGHKKERSILAYIQNGSSIHAIMAIIYAFIDSCSFFGQSRMEIIYSYPAPR